MMCNIDTHQNRHGGLRVVDHAHDLDMCGRLCLIVVVDLVYVRQKEYGYKIANGNFHVYNEKKRWTQVLPRYRGFDASRLKTREWQS